MRALSDLMRNFMQLGYVAEDIDKAADFLESKFGTLDCIRHYQSSMGGGDPTSTDLTQSWVVVDGEVADEWLIDVALVNAGSTNIEIIRPVGGAVDLYAQALRPGSPATLHHIGFRIDDFDAASAAVAGSGRAWSQYGRSGDLRFGYLDTVDTLGHFIEVMELGPDAAARFAALEAASDAGPH